MCDASTTSPPPPPHVHPTISGGYWEEQEEYSTEGSREDGAREDDTWNDTFIQALVDERVACRRSKNYERSDEIKMLLSKHNIVIKDIPLKSGVVLLGQKLNLVSQRNGKEKEEVQQAAAAAAATTHTSRRPFSMQLHNDLSTIIMSFVCFVMIYYFHQNYDKFKEEHPQTLLSDLLCQVMDLQRFIICCCRMQRRRFNDVDKK